MIKFVMGVLLGMALIKFDVLPTIKEVFVDVGGAYNLWVELHRKLI